MRTALIAIVTFATIAAAGQQQAESPAGVRLEHQSWVTAAKLLTPDSVVVLPVGAALKEHGPHLKLRNDLTLTEYFSDRVAAASAVVLTPPLTYHFYPAFLEYPGSTSLTLETARDTTIQVVRSLAQHGPRRFYVLNTGISTTLALEPAATALAQDGILLRYTDLGAALDRAASGVRQQEGGSHADEIETSMMLYIDPSSVDMSLAVKDYAPASTPLRLRRTPGAEGTYSPSGIWGDATLATREKGRVIVESVVAAMLQDVRDVREAPLPSPGAASAGPSIPAAPTRGSTSEVRQPNGCTSGAERAIRTVESRFNVAWLRKDAEAVGALWTTEGDILHHDWSSERGRETIERNRAEQFRRREFRASRHTLRFGNVRCLPSSVAVVDARWELSDVMDASGNTLPRSEGQSTVVVRQVGPEWLIEAYRYNVKEGSSPPPRLLPRPGYPDKR
jgi:creatinine amidohydrolase